MRYHIHAHFVDEQKKGFSVHHEIDKNIETFTELRDVLDEFLNSYDLRNSYGLSIGIVEEPSLVE